MTLKKNMGSFNFSAQYQQNPVPPEGSLIKWKWLRFYKEAPHRETNDQLVQSWDTASKAGELNNYSVCSTWLVKGEHFYLLDIFRERLDFPSLKRRVVRLYRKFEAGTVLIEDKGSGTQLIQDLRHEGSLQPIAILPEGDKTTRMSAQSAKIEAGYVHLPETSP